MKTFVAMMAVALLAGCGSMGMHSSGGGASASAWGQSSPSNQNRWQRDDNYHSWVN